jgi:RNA recognition motif-containing protein
VNELNLHVTNIAQIVTKFELRAFFEKVVPVTSVTIFEDGDALVGLESLEDAKKALAELDGSVLGGKVLSMRLALPRKERVDSMEENENKE